MTGPAVEIPDAIQAFIDTTNAADLEGFVASFTPDAYLNDWGRELHGREGVARWNLTDNIGVQAHFSLVSIAARAEPDAYDAVLTVSGNGHNGTGPMRFTLRDGLIARLEIIPSARS